MIYGCPCSDGQCAACEADTAETRLLTDDTVEIPRVCGDCQLQEKCCREGQ